MFNAFIEHPPAMAESGSATQPDRLWHRSRWSGLAGAAKPGLSVPSKLPGGALWRLVSGEADALPGDEDGRDSHSVAVGQAVAVDSFCVSWAAAFAAGCSQPKLGRPPLGAQLVRLITEMSRSNCLWGAPRLQAELLKLGLKVSEATVAKYMVPRWLRRGAGWRVFLRTQLAGLRESRKWSALICLRGHLLRTLGWNRSSPFRLRTSPVRNRLWPAQAEESALSGRSGWLAVFVIDAVEGVGTDEVVPGDCGGEIGF